MRSVPPGRPSVAEWGEAAACGLEDRLAAVLGREYPATTRSDCDRVLPVTGDLAVSGDDGPVVVQHVRTRIAESDHRLDCDGSADRQLRPATGPTEVGHVGIHVHPGADAVACVFG